MAVFLLGNAATALATNFTSLTVARFFAGVPHGAYFGVASLVAADLVTADRRGRAVSRVMLGLGVANVAGVPAATWLGQNAGWRSAYWLVTILAALTAVLVLWLVPHVSANRWATGRNELRAFKHPQVLLTLLAGAIGFGGMFAMYTYIAPTVTDVAGLSESRVPIYVLVFGLGMVVGTPLAGRLADWSVFRSMLVGSVMMGLTLVAFTVTSQWFLPGLLTALPAQHVQLGARRRPADAADARRRRRADDRRRDEPRLAQHRQRARRVARRHRGRGRVRLHLDGVGRSRALVPGPAGAARLGHAAPPYRLS